MRLMIVIIDVLRGGRSLDSRGCHYLRDSNHQISKKENYLWLLVGSERLVEFLFCGGVTGRAIVNNIAGVLSYHYLLEVPVVVLRG